MRQYKISNVFQQTSKVKVIQLDILKGDDILFSPGQYVDIGFANERKTLAGKYTSFSIASSPFEKESLEVVVLDLGKFRHKLYNATSGTVLNVNGPYGKFIYNHDPDHLPVFIAGGSGIAPVMSMLRFVNKKYKETPFTLFYTCKTEKDIIFFKELNDIKESNKMFECRFVTTGDTKPEFDCGDDPDLYPDKIVRGESGYINESMIVNNIKDIPLNIYYICGPYEMTVMVNFIFLKLGVDRASIKSELW